MDVTNIFLFVQVTRSEHLAYRLKRYSVVSEFFDACHYTLPQEFNEEGGGEFAWLPWMGMAPYWSTLLKYLYSRHTVHLQSTL